MITPKKQSHATLIYAAAFAALLGLTACGGPPAATSDNSLSEKAQRGYAAELVKEEGCDPRIANALAPYESEYGECTMLRLTDICGPENEEAGIALIAEVRDSGLDGVNPWLWACARTDNAETALLATCTTVRMRGTREACQCAADAIGANGTSDALVRWMAYTEAFDDNGAKAAGLGNYDLGSDKWEQLQSLRVKYYDAYTACAG